MHFIPQIPNPPVGPPVRAPVGLALHDEIEKHSYALHTTIEAREISNKILDIIFDYALNKFNDSIARIAAGRPKFLSVIDHFVVVGAQVEMCLPAFPFKFGKQGIQSAWYST